MHRFSHLNLNSTCRPLRGETCCLSFTSRLFFKTTRHLRTHRAYRQRLRTRVRSIRTRGRCILPLRLHVALIQTRICRLHSAWILTNLSLRLLRLLRLCLGLCLLRLCLRLLWLLRLGLRLRLLRLCLRLLRLLRLDLWLRLYPSLRAVHTTGDVLSRINLC